MASRLPARPLTLPSGEVQETFGSEVGKSNGDKAWAAAAEIPERFTKLPKRSGKIAQVLVPPGSSAAFTSDS